MRFNNIPGTRIVGRKVGKKLTNAGVCEVELERGNEIIHAFRSKYVILVKSSFENEESYALVDSKRVEYVIDDLRWRGFS